MSDIPSGCPCEQKCLMISIITSFNLADITLYNHTFSNAEISFWRKLVIFDILAYATSFNQAIQVIIGWCISFIYSFLLIRYLSTRGPQEWFVSVCVRTQNNFKINIGFINVNINCATCNIFESFNCRHNRTYEIGTNLTFEYMIMGLRKTDRWIERV